jgi:DNA mismatch repair ATPase MutS
MSLPKSDEKIASLLSGWRETQTDAYFELQHHFELSFGQEVVVFVEEEGFFRVFETENDDFCAGKAKEMSELLGLQLIRRESDHENSAENLLVVEIPAVSFEHYLKRLIQIQRHTVIVIRSDQQESLYLSRIISPGTNFDYVADSEEGLIVSMMIGKKDGVYFIGYAAVDVTTGRTLLCEIAGNGTDRNYALDEILALLNIHRTLEVVVTFSEEIDEQKELLDYFEIPGHCAYYVNDRRQPVSFRNKFLKDAFRVHSLFSPIEHLGLEEKPFVSEALGILVRFVAEHDRQIARKLLRPEMIDNRCHMYLGNNALEQLGIISKDKTEMTVFRLIDKSCTAVGKRLLRERLFNPTTDKKELIRRYGLVGRVYSHVRPLDEMLRGVYDLQRLARRISLERMCPGDIGHLEDSLKSVKSLMVYVKKHKILKTPFGEHEIDELVRYVQKNIDAEIFERRYTLLLGHIVHYIAELDVAVSSAKTAQENSFARPAIVDTDDNKNFLQIMQVRHPLIELQEGRENYVPNDIVMGSREYMDLPYPDTVMLDVSVHDGHDINGVLLYGINSSGKSSLMKSIGIAVLLAQSGFYVPAQSMKFSLFDSIFTRIVSKDNLLKGLSTFAVEMTELKNIFNRAGSRSLILGDEISHGTETLSGVAIVAASVIRLNEIGPLFLFATHLHQLATMDEIMRLKNVVDLHLSVEYDEVSDRLLFNRILQGGSGSSIYGLEFARSLHMDENFLNIANNIRKRLADDFDELELLVKKRTRRYAKELHRADAKKRHGQKIQESQHGGSGVLLDDWD